MLLRRVIALSLILIGMGLTAAGMGGPAAAVGSVTCTPGDPFGPAKCKPAHQLPPGAMDPSLSMTCISVYGQCQKTVNSDCGAVSGYGTPVPGTCEWAFDDENWDWGCIENNSVTVLEMRHHQSQCMYYEGTCQCVWVLDTRPSYFLELCDCVNATLGP